MWQWVCLAPIALAVRRYQSHKAPLISDGTGDKLWETAWGCSCTSFNQWHRELKQFQREVLPGMSMMFLIKWPITMLLIYLSAYFLIIFLMFWCSWTELTTTYVTGCKWADFFFLFILEKEKSQKRKLYLSTVLFLDRYRNRSMSNKSRITAPVFAWLGFQRGVRLEPDRCFQVEVYWKGTVFLERHRRGLHLNWPRTPSARHPTESGPLSWPPRQKPSRRSHCCWINSWLETL